MHVARFALGLTAAAGLIATTATVSMAQNGSSAGHPSATAKVSLTQVSKDPYTDSQAQHATEVEPDTFSYGTTIVSGFQVGRITGGGASNIGWATSADGGATWKHGFLPKTTGNTGGPYSAASDASVAYDAKHNTWLISYLGVKADGNVDVVESQSTNGGTTWGNPVIVSTGTFDDKNWSVCDNHASSPYYGNCYTEYDDVNAGDAEHVKTSTDGGNTWGAQASPADSPSGLAGQPVVQPNGTVIVPFTSAVADEERAFVSKDGGKTWGASVLLANISHHPVAGLEEANDARAEQSKTEQSTVSQPKELRESPLPSAEIDKAGKVYVVWSDCSFRSKCASNDIILSTSTDGTTWSKPVRIPIDAVSSTVDHFTPGIGVDPDSSGTTARIGLTYYYYPKAKCTASTCQLDAGYVSSKDGGKTWTTATQLAGPMTLNSLPNTSSGRMFGDYISTSVLAGGNAFPVLPVAKAPSGSTFNLAMYVPAGGLPVGTTSATH